MPLKTLSEAMGTVVTEVEERVAQGGVDVIGLPTGFAKFDEATGGLRDGILYIFGGRTAIGKSALALNIATTVALQGKEVLFLTLEMTAELLALRLLAARTGIPAHAIEHGKLDSHQLAKVHAVREDVAHLSFALYDDSISSVALLAAATKRKAEQGLDLLVVDYLTLLRDKGTSGEVERLSTISRTLHEIAQTCQIPVAALVQLNRETEKREGHRPILSDIRGSGSMEQDGAVVTFVHRPHYFDMLYDAAEPLDVEANAELIIAKNRFGPAGVFHVHFHPKLMEWRDPNHTPRQPQPTNAGSLVARIKEDRNVA